MLVSILFLQANLKSCIALVPTERQGSCITQYGVKIMPMRKLLGLQHCWHDSCIWIIMYVMSRTILITFIGMKDPYPADDETPGPILSLLKTKPFNEIFLLCSSPAFLERAHDLERELHDEHIEGKVNPIDFPIADVISYEEIWQKLIKTLDGINELMPSHFNEWYFLLDSGTPQMKACLLLAGKTGRYKARILQGIPPYHAQGIYRVRDITEATPSLPVQPVQQSISAVLHEPQTLYQGAAGEIEPNYPHPSPQERAEYASIISQSPGMREAVLLAERAARYLEPVLILGETGTGKTVLARMIHERSQRRASPFIELNCSAIPEGLAESTIFGHERGAFTGADRAKTGALRTAHRGTIFLDEIGDLSLPVQAKLLKALEEKVFLPVGSDKPVSVDVRVIAATNKDLKRLIEEGTFRRDLYQRLNVISITIPPLRKRPEDIEALIAKTLSDWNVEYGEQKHLADSARAMLRAYPWPGNVRELLNAIRSAAAICMQDEIQPEHLPDDIRLSGRGNASFEDTMGNLPEGGINLPARLLQIEWGYVSRALRTANGNREAAARMLGITGHSLRKALRERFASFVQQEGWDEE